MCNRQSVSVVFVETENEILEIFASVVFELQTDFEDAAFPEGVRNFCNVAWSRCATEVIRY